jgi:urea carboxylase
MFNKVLIANRGAIATRIIRTLKTLNVSSLVVYHEEDKHSLHVQHADEAICLGSGTASDTYLNREKILDIAVNHSANAIHPGYGFLSENTDFVDACEAKGIAFIGPTSSQMEQFGLKHEARELAEKAQVPLVPGSPLLTDLKAATIWASDVGYPIILKSTAGGGGIGMQVCRSEIELNDAWSSVRRLSANYFSNDGVFLEKFIEKARHIEVQVFGDGNGNVVSLGERDCSAQRRNQKVIEESPAPNLSDDSRKALHETAERLMASVNYRNAGTVEFIYDATDDQFYFLEVNTRLQVEHGVTELVWGVDIVDWMVKLAAGTLGDINQLKETLSPICHSVQVRLYAENPAKDFQPSAGFLSEVAWPESDHLRIDTWVETGIKVPALFDPMIAKVIVTESNRERAFSALLSSLNDSSIYGIETNKDYVSEVLKSNEAQTGTLLTNTLAGFSFKPNSVDVLVAGTQSTFQDFPGRMGYWDVGVPPSGPMDSVNFRLANYLVQNENDAVALEILLNGPSLRFNTSTHIALTGADIDATLDNSPIPMYTTVEVKEGQVLSIGRVKGEGARSYLAVDGGFQCPKYLGSKSTFTLGQFGGHVGRALRVGDVLKLNLAKSLKVRSIENTAQPTNATFIELRVMYGPHGAPDFFTEDDIDTFINSEWEVHYNSSRTGVRLIGPKPNWARESGGEAGMHPSNIHDNAYAFGTVDFTGDMPVILGPDGPSLGGFVCPATVITADLWKLGQLKAGDKLKFVPVAIDDAIQLEKEQIRTLETGVYTQGVLPSQSLENPIFHRQDLLGEEVVCRHAGDHFFLIELGPQELDIPRRFKIHALMLSLQEAIPTGVRELTPGIRSLQVHFDSQQITVKQLTSWLDAAIDQLANQDDLVVPSRIVHLPLSWNDRACQEAIDKYTQSVRPGAPWCPSNIEFIRRINGLNSIEDVKAIVFDASYLVMGLGDVYLGAPVATPVDPRHRLVTTKYNPARTWTAENSVGIGGAYMCVYGMEGPGGYQFVGRTSQMWNRYHKTKDFQKPWLLRFFDQVKFYPVTESELLDIRERVPLGDHALRIEETEFSLCQYQSFLDEQSKEISVFEQSRSKAFDEELARWKADGQFTYEQEERSLVNVDSDVIPDDVIVVDSPVSGNVWEVSVEQGQAIKKGDLLMILESMKMEIEVHAMNDGVVHALKAKAGHSVEAGQSLVWLQEK